MTSRITQLLLFVALANAAVCRDHWVADGQQVADRMTCPSQVEVDKECDPDTTCNFQAHCCTPAPARRNILDAVAGSAQILQRCQCPACISSAGNSIMQALIDADMPVSGNRPQNTGFVAVSGFSGQNGNGMVIEIRMGGAPESEMNDPFLNFMRQMMMMRSGAGGGVTEESSEESDYEMDPPDENAERLREMVADAFKKGIKEEEFLAQADEETRRLLAIVGQDEFKKMWEFEQAVEWLTKNMSDNEAKQMDFFCPVSLGLLNDPVQVKGKDKEGKSKFPAIYNRDMAKQMVKTKAKDAVSQTKYRGKECVETCKEKCSQMIAFWKGMTIEMYRNSRNDLIKVDKDRKGFAHIGTDTYDHTTFEAVKKTGFNFTFKDDGSIEWKQKTVPVDRWTPEVESSNTGSAVMQALENSGKEVPFLAQNRVENVDHESDPETDSGMVTSDTESGNQSPGLIEEQKSQMESDDETSNMDSLE